LAVSLVTSTRQAFVERVRATGIIAILRHTDSTRALESAEALLAGGVEVVEVTLNTAGAFEMISALSRHFGERAVIGAGTVLDADQALMSIESGAQFLVSPHTDSGVVEIADSMGCPVVPGAFTPTEIVRAWRLGADLVKVFPVGSVGPRYIRDIRAPLPDVPLVPTGGVTLDNAAEFIAAGAHALGLGSDLVNPSAVAARDFNGITERARAFIAAVARGRG
jgi:2-dehydro-3-deoxyphosphogluconate aldolase/(4S)-4-hydroxy-2-oxoglutarate aldolase